MEDNDVHENIYSQSRSREISDIIDRFNRIDTRGLDVQKQPTPQRGERQPKFTPASPHLKALPRRSSDSSNTASPRIQYPDSIESNFVIPTTDHDATFDSLQADYDLPKLNYSAKNGATASKKATTVASLEPSIPVENEDEGKDETNSVLPRAAALMRLALLRKPQELAGYFKHFSEVKDLNIHTVKFQEGQVAKILQTIKLEQQKASSKPITPSNASEDLLIFESSEKDDSHAFKVSDYLNEALGPQLYVYYPPFPSATETPSAPSQPRSERQISSLCIPSYPGFTLPGVEMPVLAMDLTKPMESENFKATTIPTSAPLRHGVVEPSDLSFSFSETSTDVCDLENDKTWNEVVKDQRPTPAGGMAAAVIAPKYRPNAETLKDGRGGVLLVRAAGKVKVTIDSEMHNPLAIPRQLELPESAKVAAPRPQSLMPIQPDFFRDPETAQVPQNVPMEATANRMAPGMSARGGNPFCRSYSSMSIPTLLFFISISICIFADTPLKLPISYLLYSRNEHILRRYFESNSSRCSSYATGST